MDLHNRKGHEFHLKIVGYQFPDILDRYWDSNWLNVQISGVNASGAWSVEDSCLLTFEVERLAVWLEKLAVDKSSEQHIYFTEPSPDFRVIKHGTDIYSLRVGLGYIFRMKMPDVFGNARFIWLYFPLQEIDLPYQARLLRTQLDQYPQRVFR